MDLKILFILGIYWTLISLVFAVGVGSDEGNILVDNEYSSEVNINSTGFTSDELDSGGFFSGIIGIFTAMARIVGFYTFGITSQLSGTAQLIFSAWTVFISIFTIGFIISAFWNG